MTLPVAFIDADILIHRALAFTDGEFDGERINDWRSALANFEALLDRWRFFMPPISDYYLVVSPDHNFRKDIFPEYKANRKDIVPHPSYATLKEKVKEYQSAIWEDGIEADDLIGLSVTANPNSIAVSADKDFATVPCTLFIPPSHGKEEGKLHTFSEAEADVNWLRQALTGDTIDNYKGIPRVGPVKAAQIIPGPAPVDVLWGKVKHAFLSHGMTEEDALTMVRLARILRHGDYDFDTKEVKLWMPPRPMSDSGSDASTTTTTQN